LVEFPGEFLTSAPSFAHGVAQDEMNASEQVSGRARRVQVEIVLQPEQWPRLRDLLRTEFIGTGVRFWAAPIADHGVCA
ncbi:MAG: DUF3240 family protein, partial [Rhodanobacteraceae bacterium]